MRGDALSPRLFTLRKAIADAQRTPVGGARHSVRCYEMCDKRDAVSVCDLAEQVFASLCSDSDSKDPFDSSDGRMNRTLLDLRKKPVRGR